MINDNIYIINGYATGVFTFNMMYNIATDAWTQQASPPFTAAKLHSFAIGNYGYLGISNFWGNTQDWYQYDPVVNSWIIKATFPGGARADAACFSIGTNGYIVGGTNNNNDVWEYNSVADTWTAKNNAPWMREDASSFVINQKAYIIAGRVNGAASNDCWEYDPVPDSWTAKANVPGSMYYAAIAFNIGNRGYFGFGDYTPNGNYFYEYDVAADTWIPRNNNGATSFYFHCTPAFGTTTKGYTGASKGTPQFGGDNWYEYIPDTTALSLLPPVADDDVQVTYLLSEKKLQIKNSGYSKNIMLTIYNSNGQLCFRKGFFASGELGIILEPLLKTRGVYVYHLSFGGKALSGKIVL